ncbi:MAG: sugar transferase [Spirulinaceae cyanobacterium]
MTSQTPEIPEADFKTNFSDQVASIEMPERITILEAVAFKATFQEILVVTPSPQKIVLNFTKNTFIDSSGIGALVTNFKAAKKKGLDLLLKNVHPQVMAVFVMNGLDQVLNIQPQTKKQTQSLSNNQESQPPATHPSTHSLIKRLIDIIGGLVGLMITGILFIPIVMAIKLESPGPIFFAQTRHGWLGKKFKIWKFRSMCIDAEKRKSEIQNQASGAFFKNENDPRITKVGSFLRKTSLDELPQFWNVVRGEMSLVGTRPPTSDEVEHYDIPEWQRFDVKPGMTGEWQVNGRSQIREFEDVIKMDLRYQKNWSLAYDIKLILKTILILFHKNSGAV